MEKIIVKRGNGLKGEVDISCAKNSILPIIAATVLSSEDIILENVPMLEDVRVILNVLKSLNGSVKFIKDSGKIVINNKDIKMMEPNEELIRKMRASFLIMGPMLARFGQCRLSMPGGCNIGSRPIDLHLKGFNLLGADINSEHGFIDVSCRKLKGNTIYLDFPSVGATENIMMASVLAEGVTVIENAAKEPEIIDLANFLNKIGADVNTAEMGKVIINGVSSVHGTSYIPIYDRIEAGTFMIAAGITGSRIKINGVDEEHLRPLIEKLKECGFNFEKSGEKSLYVDGRGELNPVNIKTMPYPGFPTDMQAQMMAMLSLVKGTSIVTETVFENRFMHVSELQRMGADIKIDGRCAIIDGVNKLTGCEVHATDLRAGAAMILCGLVAEGETTITDIYHIDRGYDRIEEKLRKLGADIVRKEDKK